MKKTLLPKVAFAVFVLILILVVNVLGAPRFPEDLDQVSRGDISHGFSRIQDILKGLDSSQSKSHEQTTSGRIDLADILNGQISGGNSGGGGSENISGLLRGLLGGLSSGGQQQQQQQQQPSLPDLLKVLGQGHAHDGPQKEKNPLPDILSGILGVTPTTVPTTVSTTASNRSVDATTAPTPTPGPSQNDPLSKILGDTLGGAGSSDGRGGGNNSQQIPDLLGGVLGKQGAATNGNSNNNNPLSGILSGLGGGQSSSGGQGLLSMLGPLLGTNVQQGSGNTGGANQAQQLETLQQLLGLLKKIRSGQNVNIQDVFEVLENSQTTTTAPKVQSKPHNQGQDSNLDTLSSLLFQLGPPTKHEDSHVDGLGNIPGLPDLISGVLSGGSRDNKSSSLATGLLSHARGPEADDMAQMMLQMAFNPSFIACPLEGESKVAERKSIDYHCYSFAYRLLKPMASIVGDCFKQRFSKSYCENSVAPTLKLPLRSQVSYFVPCAGVRPGQFVATFRHHDHSYNCLDRSDESRLFEAQITKLNLKPNHNNKNDTITYEDLVDLSPCPGREREGPRYPGTGDEGECLPAWSVLCPLSKLPPGPTSDRWIYNASNICSNSTFWSQFECSVSGGKGEVTRLQRCTGNSPGFCHDNLCRAHSYYCPDKSDLICNKNDTDSDTIPAWDLSSFFTCYDGSQKIHRHLVCDGYIHCNDKSDEKKDICSDCSHSESGGSISCQHKYSKRPICQVPCDKHSLCLNREDEECDVVVWWHVVISLLVLAFLTAILLWFLQTLAKTTNNKDTISQSWLHMVEIADARAIKALLKIFREGDFNVTKNSRLFRIYKSLHPTTEAVQFAVTVACNLGQDERETEALAALYECETTIHSGDGTKALDECLHASLASSELKARLFDAAFPGFFAKVKATVKGKLSRAFEVIAERLQKMSTESLVFKQFKKYIKDHLSSVTATLPLIAQVIFYYTDTIKDFIFFYALLQIAEHQHEFANIAMQFALAAGLSVLMPHILNMVLFLAKWQELYDNMTLDERPKTEKESKSRRIIFVMISLLFSPLLLALAISKMAYFKVAESKKSDKMNMNSNTSQVVDNFKELHNIKKKSEIWKKAFISIKLNENAAENFSQAVLGFLLIGMSYTSTGTAKEFSKLKGGKSLLILAASALWSVKTVVQANVNATKGIKEVGLVGQVILGLLFFVCAAQRIAMLMLYFTPSFGLANVMASYHYGTIQFELDMLQEPLVYDIRRDNVTGQDVEVTVDEVWKKVGSVDELTSFSLTTLYIALLCGVVIHFVIVAILKIIISPSFRKSTNVTDKALHVITNIDCPKTFSDWDDGHKADFKKRIKEIIKEYLSMLVIFSLEHLLLCIPLLILLTNLLQRHNELDPYFPILPEEQDSIDNVRTLLILGIVTSAVITPVLQVALASAYYLFGHPWSRLFKSMIFNEEDEQDDGLPQGWYDIFNTDPTPIE